MFTPRHMRARLALALLCLLGWAACKDEKVRPATEVVVAIDSDLTAGEQLQRIEVEVQNADGESVDDDSFDVVEGTPGDGEVNLPFSFGITKGKAAGFQLIVRGYGDGDAPSVEQKSKGSFQDGKSLLLVVFLSKVCLDNVCDDGETCYWQAHDGVGAGDCGDLPTPTLGMVNGDGLGGLAGRGGGRGAGEGGAAARAGAGGAGRGGAGGNAAGRGGAGGAGAGGASGGGAGGYGGSAGAAAMGGSGGGAATCTGCKSTEKCVDGRCECATALTTYYEDFDEDGHGDPNVSMTVCGPAPSGYVTSKDDCCDEDATAYPGQTLGFDVEVSCDEGGYDYNCDGREEQGFPNLASGTCCVSWVNGWAGTTIPACGDSGTLIVCNTTTCQPENGQVGHICR